jgi:hypothetical protein
MLSKSILYWYLHFLCILVQKKTRPIESLMSQTKNNIKLQYCFTLLSTVKVQWCRLFDPDRPAFREN